MGSLRPPKWGLAPIHFVFYSLFFSVINFSTYSKEEWMFKYHFLHLQRSVCRNASRLSNQSRRPLKFVCNDLTTLIVSNFWLAIVTKRLHGISSSRLECFLLNCSRVPSPYPTILKLLCSDFLWLHNMDVISDIEPKISQWILTRKQ